MVGSVLEKSEPSLWYYGCQRRVPKYEFMVDNPASLWRFFTISVTTSIQSRTCSDASPTAQKPPIFLPITIVNVSKGRVEFLAAPE